MNCICDLERKRIDTENGWKIYDKSSYFDINFKIFVYDLYSEISFYDMHIELIM